MHLGDKVCASRKGGTREVGGCQGSLKVTMMTLTIKARSQVTSRYIEIFFSLGRYLWFLIRYMYFPFKVHAAITVIAICLFICCQFLNW